MNDGITTATTNHTSMGAKMLGAIGGGVLGVVTQGIALLSNSTAEGPLNSTTAVVPYHSTTPRENSDSSNDFWVNNQGVLIPAIIVGAVVGVVAAVAAIWKVCRHHTDYTKSKITADHGEGGKDHGFPPNFFGSAAGAAGDSDGNNGTEMSVFRDHKLTPGLLLVPYPPSLSATGGMEEFGHLQSGVCNIVCVSCKKSSKRLL